MGQILDTKFQSGISIHSESSIYFEMAYSGLLELALRWADMYVLDAIHDNGKILVSAHKVIFYDFLFP